MARHAPNSDLSLLDLSIVDSTGGGNAPASVVSVTDDENDSWTRAVTTITQPGAESSPVTAEQWYCAHLGLARPAPADAQVGQASAPDGMVGPLAVTSSSIVTGDSFGDVVIADVGYVDGSLSGLPAGFTNSPPQSSAGLGEQGGYMTGAFQGTYSYGGSLDTAESIDGWAGTAVAFDEQEIFQPSGCSETDATTCINLAIQAAQAAYDGFAPPPSTYSVSDPPPAKPTAGPEIVPNMVYIPSIAGGAYLIDGSIEVNSPTWSSSSGDFPDWGDPVDIVGSGARSSPTPTTLMANARSDQELLAVRASGTVVNNIDLDGFDGPGCVGEGGCAADAFASSANDVTLENFSAEGDNQNIAVNFFGPSDPNPTAKGLDCNQAYSEAAPEPTITDSGTYTPADCNYNNVAQNGTVVAQPQPSQNGAIVMALQDNAVMQDLSVQGDYVGAWRSNEVTAGNIEVGPGPVNNYPDGFEAWITGSSNVNLQDITVDDQGPVKIGAGQITCAPKCTFGQATNVQITNEQAPGATLQIGDVGSATDSAVAGVTINDSRFGQITVNPQTIGQTRPASGTIDASTYESLDGNIDCAENTVASSGGISVLGSDGLYLCPATSGLPAMLVFTSQPPSSVVAGASVAVQVSIEDAEGNVVTSDDNPVNLSLAAGPGGSQLSGCSGSTDFGVANLTCQVDEAGGGYQLGASDAGDSLQATSSSFVVTPGPPEQLVFTGEPPSSVVAGANVAVQVAVEDAEGNLVTSDDNPVALSLAAGPGGSQLSGCSATNAQSGVATFTCQVDRSGTGYVLSASDANDSIQATSSSFAVTPGTPAKLLFAGQPPPRIGSKSTFKVRVTVVDSFGNLVTGEAVPVSLTLMGRSGAGAFTCAVDPVMTQAGSARFQCSIAKPGKALYLNAQAPDLPPAVSRAVKVT